MPQLWTRAVASGLLVIAAFFNAGCAPELDWREVRLPRGGVAVSFPCRPSSYERPLQLAGMRVVMGLSACRAGGVTWAAAHADVGDPAQVTTALLAMRAAAIGNIDGQVESALALRRPGITPNEAGVEMSIGGHFPDGQAARSKVAVFAVGTSVFQVSAVASTELADWPFFIASLRVRPQ